MGSRGLGKMNALTARLSLAGQDGCRETCSQSQAVWLTEEANFRAVYTLKLGDLGQTTGSL